MFESVLHRLLIPVTFILLWSTAFIATKYGMLHAPPLALLALRMLITVVLLGGWLALREREVLLQQCLDRQSVGQVLVGLLVHGCYLGGVFIAIDRGMDVGFAALVVGLQPIVTALLASGFLGERLNVRVVCGLLAGLVGLAVVVEGRFGLAGELGTLTGWVAIVVALAGISGGTLLQKRVGQQGRLLVNTWIQYCAAALMFLLFSMMTEQWQFSWNLQLALSLAWMVFAISLGAIPLLMIMIRAGEMTRVSSLFYLVTPVTALLACWLFEEQLTVQSGMGMALAVLGVALVVMPGLPVSGRAAGVTRG